MINVLTVNSKQLRFGDLPGPASFRWIIVGPGASPSSLAPRDPLAQNGRMRLANSHFPQRTNHRICP